jgi:hypothetical protein
MQPLLTLPCEIGAEFVGVWRRDVERCVEHARRAKCLGSAWSVSGALDFGKHVLIRFEQAPDLQDPQRFTVRVNKATRQVTPKGD